MATRIYQVLTFTNVAGGGGQATLPHNINVDGVARIPDFLYPDAGGFTLVAADATSVTVQNNNAVVASLDVALFFIYSTERLFGQAASHLTPQPFWVSGGGSSSGGGLWAAGAGAGSVVQDNATGNAAAGANALAAGAAASGLREEQIAFASGDFAAAGDAQFFFEVLRGSTPGAAPGEAVELKFGALLDQTLQLEDGKAYLITVEAVAKDTVAGGKGAQCFVQRYAVHRAGGVTAAPIAGAADQFGDPASVTWTLVASVGAAPDRFVLTFTTTGAQAAAKVVASLKVTEVLNA